MAQPSHARRWFFLVTLALIIGVGVWWLADRPLPVPDTERVRDVQLRELARRLTQLEMQERHADETTWALELAGAPCGQVFENLWDRLNSASNALPLLGSVPFGEAIVASLQRTTVLGNGWTAHEPGPHRQNWSHPDWVRFLSALEQRGWRLERTEFRHLRFIPDASGRPKRSVFYGSAHLESRQLDRRVIVEGDFTVDWQPAAHPTQFPRIVRIDASALGLHQGPAKPAFREVLHDTVAPFEKSSFIDPLILRDLDGDGSCEIILASRNRVYHREPDGRFAPRELLAHFPGLLFTAILADFTGDGVPDFLGARFEGLVLFPGAPDGVFRDPGRSSWQAGQRLRYGQVLTCGDVDGDGDLDVWLGQYKNPYDRGQMPTPYHDANDGNPAYLLLNDGQGKFTDWTESAGLGLKRWRRSYGGSFVDLDDDNDLDLLVVNDFAGLDLYRNDGRGRFVPAHEWIEDGRGFGMAHTMSDFDRDGQLDLLVTGMHCSTALRLDALGLRRPGCETTMDAHRGAMTRGNRLWLRRGQQFAETPLGESVARSGWSWSPAAAAFNNATYPDLSVANGHETRQSVRDYDEEFWRHDIYVASSQEDPVLNAYFGGKFLSTRGRGWSYGGYEANRLFLNQAGRRFHEVAFLAGVAMPEDSRNAVAADLDGDGRMDLVVTTFEVWPEVRQTVRVFRNELAETGNWIAFRLRGPAPHHSSSGARVRIRHDGVTQVGLVLTGESHRVQPPEVVHFGLGASANVEHVEVRWIPRGSLELTNLAANRVCDVKAR